MSVDRLLQFGIDVFGPVRRLVGTEPRRETERPLDEVDDRTTEPDAAVETFLETQTQFERTMRAYDDEPTGERERRIGQLLADLEDQARELERLATTIEERREAALGDPVADDVARIRREATRRRADIESAIAHYDADVDAYVRDWTTWNDSDVEELLELAAADDTATTDGDQIGDRDGLDHRRKGT